jgi:hypothetical protein
LNKLKEYTLWLKGLISGINFSLLIHPPLSNPTIGIRAGSFKRQFNHWKEIMEYTENGVPLFNGQNGLEYEMWSIRKRTFLKAQGYDIWYSVVTGYNATKT